MSNKNDYLFDDVFDKSYAITEAIKANIRNKKIRGNVRLSTGMYRTDKEKEKYLRESLERRLP